MVMKMAMIKAVNYIYVCIFGVQCSGVQHIKNVFLCFRCAVLIFSSFQYESHFNSFRYISSSVHNNALFFSFSFIQKKFSFYLLSCQKWFIQVLYYFFLLLLNAVIVCFSNGRATVHCAQL